MADDVEMDMDTILASFSNLNFVRAAVPEAVPESTRASWTHRETSDGDDDDEGPDEVKSVLDPFPSPVADAAPRWLFTRTPWVAGGFDYGIMTRSRPVVQNRQATPPRAQREPSHLPRAFMLASNMLSIRDPWEEAAANGYFNLTKKSRTGSSVFWAGVACVVTAGSSIIWAYNSDACAGLYACTRQSVRYHSACRVFFLFE